MDKEWEYLGAACIDQLDNNQEIPLGIQDNFHMLKTFMGDKEVSDFSITDSCSDCGISINRKYMCLLRSGKEFKWVGSSCVEKYIPQRYCSICDSYYGIKFVAVKTCPNCRDEKLESYERKSFGSILNRAMDTVKYGLRYKNYCTSFIYGDTDHNFYKFLIDSGKFMRPMTSFPFLTSGKYRGCSVYHIHLALSGDYKTHDKEIPNELGPNMIEEIDNIISSHCMFCDEKFYYMDTDFKFVKLNFHTKYLGYSNVTKDCKDILLKKYNLKSCSDKDLMDVIEGKLLIKLCRICGFNYLGDNSVCELCGYKYARVKVDRKCIKCNRYYYGGKDICNETGDCEKFKFGLYSGRYISDIVNEDTSYCTYLSNDIKKDIEFFEHEDHNPRKGDIIIDCILPNMMCNCSASNYSGCSFINLLKSNQYLLIKIIDSDHFTEIFHIYKHRRLIKALYERENCKNVYTAIMRKIEYKILNSDKGTRYKDFKDKYYGSIIYNALQDKEGYTWMRNKEYLVEYMCYVNCYFNDFKTNNCKFKRVKDSTMVDFYKEYATK